MFKVDQVPWKERISYGLSDLASNLIFTMVSTYLLFFYTDVFGIGAGIVGTLFLLVRFLDAGTDLLAGYVIDRTKSRWGKFRPYFLFLAVPFAIVGIIAFSTPDLSPMGKVIYAYVTYIILGLVYTFINIPISSMLPSMSNNAQERHTVSSVRLFFGQIGGLIVSVGALPLVAFFGNGNQSQGFFWTMVLFGVISIPLFINAFVNTRERDYYKSKSSVSFKEGMKAFKGNWPWLIIFLAKTSFFFIYIIRNQSTVYYMTYNVGRADLVPLAMGLNFLSMAAILTVPFFTKRFGGKMTMQIGLVTGIVGVLVLYAGASISSLFVFFLGLAISGFGLGLLPSLLFSLIADTVDYGEWKSGVRANGLLYSGSTFAAKFGMGIGGAIGAWLLAWGGYVPNQAQQAGSALTAIELSFVWLPAIVYLLNIILLNFYKLDKQHDQVVKDLEARANASEPANQIK